VPEIMKDSPVCLVALQTVREPCSMREEARFRTSVRQFGSCLVDSGWSHRISAVMRARRPLHKTAHRVSLDVSRSNRVAKLSYTVAQTTMNTQIPYFVVGGLSRDCIDRISE